MARTTAGSKPMPIPDPPDAPRVAKRSAEEETGPTEMVVYRHEHIFQARELTLRDWTVFGVDTSDPESKAKHLRWGPENDWMVEADTLREFLSPEQFDAAIRSDPNFELVTVGGDVPESATE